MVDPNLLPVDPAPLRRSRLDADRPATERELREALDRRVPMKDLFRYRQSHSISEVEFKTWEARWKPVLLAETSPDARKRPGPRAPFVTKPKPPTRELATPEPLPHPSPAYTDPKQLLSDPQSLEKVRQATEKERRQNARQHRRELRLATQVSHRLPRPGEQYSAAAAGTVSTSCASSFPPSSVNSTLRRWSKPEAAQSSTEPLNDDAGRDMVELKDRIRLLFEQASHGSASSSRKPLVGALSAQVVSTALDLPAESCEPAIDRFALAFDEHEEVTVDEFVSFFFEQMLATTGNTACTAASSTLPVGPMPSFASASNWSLGSQSFVPSVASVASDWGLDDDWQGVDPSLDLRPRPVPPPIRTARPGTNGPCSPVSLLPETSTSSIASLRPSTGGRIPGISILSFGSNSDRSHCSRSPNGSTRGYRRQQKHGRMSPRHLKMREVEMVLQEVMGSRYPGRPRDYKVLPMKPDRAAPEPPPRAKPKETIWAQLSGELSFERDRHAKLANSKLRDGDLTKAVDSLTAAIDRQNGVESTADQRAQRGEDRPNTSEAAARLVEQRSFYYLVAGDVDAALADANRAIEMSAGNPLGTAKAHYHKALALHSRTAHIVNKVESASEAEKRKAIKHEALRSVSQALQHCPTDSRYKKLYHRLWREINTDFSDSISNAFVRKEPLKPPAAGARVKPPTPPPAAPMQKKKGDWSEIDIRDIQSAQEELRTSISGMMELIERGEAPDAKHLYAFTRVMKKSYVPNKLAKQVLDSLESDNAASSGENVEEHPSPSPMQDPTTALSDLRPNGLEEEWANVVQILERERGHMMVVFRYYCVEGGATDAAASDSMNLSQWIRFCKDAGFGSTNQPGLSASELPLIFLRANQDKPEEDKFTSVKDLVQRKPKNNRTDNEDEMVFHEFAEGCIRVAYNWKREITGLATRVQILVDEKIKAHKCFSQLHDDIDDRMESNEMSAVFERHDTALRKVFVHYAAEDKTAFDGAQQDTINMMEWQQLMRECGFFDGVTTVRTATAVFVKVNMGDDLYDNEDVGDGNSAEELVYQEFLECVARVAAERERVQKNKTSEQDDGNFAAMVEQFIETELVKMFLTRVKGKSKGKKLLKAATNAIRMTGKR